MKMLTSNGAALHLNLNESTYVHKISNRCRNNRNYNTFSASKETPIEPVIYERGTSML
jgi:hypothetical protein